MPASGKRDIMSQSELHQRETAPLKHGVYAKTVTPEKAATLALLGDKLSTRPGVIDAMIDQAAKAVAVADLALGYVSTRHKAGVGLDSIPMARALPAFLNSAARSLAQLYGMLPDENKTFDITELLQGGGGDDDNSAND